MEMEGQNDQTWLFGIFMTFFVADNQLLLTPVWGFYDAPTLLKGALSSLKTQQKQKLNTQENWHIDIMSLKHRLG